MSFLQNLILKSADITAEAPEVQNNTLLDGSFIFKISVEEYAVWKGFIPAATYKIPLVGYPIRIGVKLGTPVVNGVDGIGQVLNAAANELLKGWNQAADVVNGIVLKPAYDIFAGSTNLFNDFATFVSGFIPANDAKATFLKIVTGQDMKMTVIPIYSTIQNDSVITKISLHTTSDLGTTVTDLPIVPTFKDFLPDQIPKLANNITKFLVLWGIFTFSAWVVGVLYLVFTAGMNVPTAMVMMFHKVRRFIPFLRK